MPTEAIRIGRLLGDQQSAVEAAVEAMIHYSLQIRTTTVIIMAAF
jgi:hypothetical protein